MSHFRLPTIDELKTLLHPDQGKDVFGKQGRFWSSSPVADNSALAWYVNFDSGNVYTYFKHSTRHVRLVRADSALPIDDLVDAGAPDRLVDNGDDTHTDRHTGLIWRSQPEDGEFTWEAAPEDGEFTWVAAMAAFPALPTSNPMPQAPIELDWSALGPTVQWG